MVQQVQECIVCTGLLHESPTQDVDALLHTALNSNLKHQTLRQAQGGHSNFKLSARFPFGLCALGYKKRLSSQGDGAFEVPRYHPGCQAACFTRPDHSGAVTGAPGSAWTPRSLHRRDSGFGRDSSGVIFPSLRFPGFHCPRIAGNRLQDRYCPRHSF
jgi:hypothetical protein